MGKYPRKRKIDRNNIVVGTINVDGYSIPPSISDVDFMCGIDGKSDVEVIQEAINASRNHSRIILKKGNYSIDAPIYMYGVTTLISCLASKCLLDLR